MRAGRPALRNFKSYLSHIAEKEYLLKEKMLDNSFL